MSKINEIIVLQIPDKVDPCTAYLLDNGDGTHDRYVSDENGNISKQAGGGSSLDQDNIPKVVNITLTDLGMTSENTEAEINQALSNYINGLNLTVGEKELYFFQVDGFSDLVGNKITSLENLKLDKGINHTWSPINRTLTLFDKDGNQLSQVSLVSLDNEGTDLRYNASTLSLELYNGDNELLDSIPVSSFIGSVGTQLQLNSNELQLKDSQGNVLSTVNFTVNNVFQEVSATQKGIVNNIALQELGGVDKSIHDIRVGTGNGTATGWSTVLGKDALSTNTSGENNTAIGRDSLKLNTIGSYNTAVGDYTLPNNISGNYNTITGSKAGYNNTTGYNNSGYGAFSLGSTTTGSRNTAIGYGTGYKITTGTLNFIAGNNAGNNIITGSQNICIGQQSGKTITNGSENICIGGASGTSSTGATTANGSIADGRSNVFIGTNIGLYGGLSGVNNSHYLIIHNYRNDGVPIVDSNNPLIKGHFVDRWLTIGGKLSVTPTYMPNATGDSTYTKNIVAKPDGTFGWEDKKTLEINVSKGTTFPSVPNPGDLFFNTTDNKHYGFDGTSWNALY